MKKRLFSVILSCFVSFAFVGNASAALLGWDLVDSGKHLDYDGNSNYMSTANSAVNVWENYKYGIIRKDSGLVMEDVYVSDFWYMGNTLGVTYEHGRIQFNLYQFDTITSSQRLKTAIHEFGHALGLEHTWGSSDVMQQGVLSINSLSSTDRSSYDSAYRGY